MVHIEELNSTELEKFDQFVELAADLKFDKGTLLRFLKARNYDLRKAEDMIRASVLWRIENQQRYFGSPCDGWEPPHDVLNGVLAFFCGYDYDGRPVYFTPFGNWACGRDLYKMGYQADCLRFAGEMIEIVMKMLLATKHQNLVVIVDNAGITFRKIFYEAQNLQGINDVTRLCQEYDSNFPETLSKAYYLNTPKVFYWGFNIIKPFISQRTLDKMNFFASGDPSVVRVLHDSLPIEAIPPQYGGTAKLRPVWPWPHNDSPVEKAAMTAMNGNEIEIKH